MHAMQNKKNKDQFNNRKRNEKKREEKGVFVGALRAPRPAGLTGPPANAVTPGQATNITTKFNTKEQHNTWASRHKITREPKTRFAPKNNSTESSEWSGG